MIKYWKIPFLFLFNIIILLSWIPNSYGTNQKQITNTKKIMAHINGKKFALVIGIDKYPTMPLEAAVNDAKAVSKRLSELNFQVTTLLDSQATLKNIRHELGTKFSLTSPNDQIVIYFAGHGITEKLHSKKMVGYILPVNANIKDLYTTAISMNELRDLTARIPAKHILFAFDSCYSGLGLTRSIKVVSANESLQQHLESLAESRAVYMITAGKATEVAREFRGHGLFTLHFLDGIAGAADTDPKDKIVQASELGRYLASVVSNETNREQNPQHGMIEGDGDFLFPLMDDDPIRLRKSLLSRLSVQSDEILKRKNIQDEFNKQMNLIIKSEKVYRDEYDRKVSELDVQIKKKQAEVLQLTKSMTDISKSATTREQYNLMKFLNTGVEIDILKVFPDLKATKIYFTKALGYKGKKPLNLKTYKRWIPDQIKKKLKIENAYPTKVESYTSKYKNSHWLLTPYYKTLKIKEYSYKLAPGYIDHVKIKTITPSIILSQLNQINSPLNQNNTTYIEEIKYVIDNITSNKKLLLFNQFSDRMIARYGKPTNYGKKIKVSNWKTGRESQYREMIWEDKYVNLRISGYYSSIYIYIKNTSQIIKEIYKQAINICEAEQLVLLKGRIEKMADLERRKTHKAKKLDF